MDRVIRLLVQVSGHVQGVWFRNSTREQARRLGVAGWVRNLPNGDVEAALEGLPPAVAELLEWMRHGPPGAAVLQVKVTDQDPQGDTTFDIAR